MGAHDAIVNNFSFFADGFSDCCIIWALDRRKRAWPGLLVDEIFISQYVENRQDILND